MGSIFSIKVKVRDLCYAFCFALVIFQFCNDFQFAGFGVGVYGLPRVFGEYHIKFFNKINLFC